MAVICLFYERFLSETTERILIKFGIRNLHQRLLRKFNFGSNTPNIKFTWCKGRTALHGVTRLGSSYIDPFDIWDALRCLCLLGF
jgi:hypothetical protein